MKVKVRSAKMVTTQGITIPLWLWVRALNCFTNSMMFTPCGPRAVPTGGAGVAAPAGHWSFTTAWIFLAISLLDIGGCYGAPRPAAMTRAVAGNFCYPDAIPLSP